MDGEIVGSHFTSALPEVNSYNLVIGRNFCWGGDVFKGIIDDIYIYNRALSEAEIQLLYNDCKPLNTKPEANAGIDQTLELSSCAGTEVQLNGSGSTDPDNNIELYEWFEGEILLGEGRIYTITYRATDCNEVSSTASAIVTVPHDMN